MLTQPIRIVVADDVDLVLHGVQSILAGWPEAEVIGAYQTVPDLYTGLNRQCPEVILLDDRIDPDCGPLQVIHEVRRLCPRGKILVLGSIVDGMIVQEFFAHGIHGYLYKADPLAETLVTAIRTVLLGRPYLSPTAGSEHLLAMQGGRRRWQLDEEALTVLRLLAEGNHVNQVSQKMGKPMYRIYAVRNKLRARFGAENNEAMISRATAEGFLP
jgi:DNA-binding NarL/FixJ family response regulator